jgi:dTDP-4-amino-4,6-dideoxygalactose transaminase
MNPKIYLSSPHMGGTEQDFVSTAFETNWIAPLGPNVVEFETRIETYLVTDKHVAALSSGTAAIHLALVLLGVSRDDEVLCQSFTFSASANPIVYQGATPIFIDSEVETWNMCPIHLETAIKDRIAKGKKPKAIIAVHLYGMPCKIEAIRAVADTYEIPIVEDSAEALGSTYKGKKCGTFGDIGILSFNGNKIITTSGGGALVLNTAKVKEKAIFLATQARDPAPHYQHSHIGYNYRLSNICAGIGCGQMEVLDAHISLRREMNKLYGDLFANVEGVTVFKEPSAAYVSNHWLSCVTIESEKTGYTSEEVIWALAKDNIESRPLWKPMHLQPIFVDAPYYGNTLAEDLFKKGLCLPSGSNLSNTEKQRIKKALKPFV